MCPTCVHCNFTSCWKTWNVNKLESKINSSPTVSKLETQAPIPHWSAHATYCADVDMKTPKSTTQTKCVKMNKYRCCISLLEHWTKNANITTSNWQQFRDIISLKYKVSVESSEIAAVHWSYRYAKTPRKSMMGKQRRRNSLQNCGHT